VNLSDFDFALPPDRIAHTPARPRDSARLLVVGDALQDRIVAELPSLLRPGDVLVANDTRVIPAQLEARRGQARVGLTLDQPRPDGSWHALARNARRLRPGDRLSFDRDPALAAEIIGRDGDSVTVRFEGDFTRAGALALPPYIERPQGPTSQDEADYQTVFAAHAGAVAAPTAGLHFTARLLAGLEAAAIPRVTITLHVGAGTFLPVRTDDVSQHRMHAERGEITAAAADAINRARRVVAVGTTSLRLLESAADEHGFVTPFSGDTRLFITPGHRFRRVGALLTNFHLPKSTLFMLVCAFAGTGRMRDAYAHAIASGYRFYSYGDACLLERE
jgi:S-adenosylmethionine:tRNA ribosyltransferase-isomerase